MNVGQRAVVGAGVALLVATGSGPAAASPSPPTPGRLFPSSPQNPERSTAVAAGGAPALAPGGYDVPTFGYDVARTGNDTAEQALGRSTVGGLTQVFATGFANAGAVDAPPIGASNVATPSGPRDLIYVGNEHGAFGAVDAGTGAVVWEQDVGFQHTACGDFPNGDAGVTGSAVLDRPAGRVFVAGGDGLLHAFDMGTGAPAAGWPTPALIPNPERLHDYGALTLDAVHHRIYATFASYCDFAPYKGAVVSVDSGTGSDLRAFVVVQNGLHGGGNWGWGGASLDAAGDPFVTTGNALPNGPDESTPYAEYILKLSPTFVVRSADHPTLSGRNMDFGATPTLIDVPGCPGLLAAENKDGHLFAYGRNSLGAGPVQDLTIVDSRGLFLGLPAFDAATGTLYITNPAAGPTPHGMIARRFDSTCTTRPLWHTTAGPAASPVSSPTIANGVVYYADGTGRTVHAFHTGTGAELWHSPAGTFTGDVFGAPLVFDGRIYVSSRGGTVHAFG